MEPIRFVFPAGDGNSALAICSNPADFRNLGRLFAHSGLKLRGATTIADALPNLDGVSVVLCDEVLPDGGWAMLADAVSHAHRPPSIIVISRNANEQLWTEVLNRGGFDMLRRPFSTSELFRVVVGAWRSWKVRAAHHAVAGAA